MPNLQQKKTNIYKEELGDEEGGDEDDSDERLSVCKTTIVSALQIKRVILDEPQALASVLQADELLQDQSPYFKLTNLAIVAARVKQDKDDGLWCMSLMNDYSVCDPNDSSWSKRQLGPRNGKGLLGVFSFKRKVRDELLNKVWDSLTLPAEDKHSMRRFLGSLDSDREASGYRL